MKVLFVFGGLPHYYNAILNKLNNIKDVEVSVVVPSNKGNTIGAGVSQTKKGIDFKIITSQEERSFYGKSKLADLTKIIANEAPDIVVVIWPYILQFLFNPFLKSKLKKNNIKLIHKDIPFLTPIFQDGIKIKKRFSRDENLLSDNNAKLDLSITGLTLLRKIYYKIIDAFVCYIEDAYRIYSSYGVPEEKVFVTYNSPDTENLFEARKEVLSTEILLDPNPYRIIHVGRLVKWKKVHILLDAVGRLKNKYNNIELLVVGSGPEEDALKKQAADLGIEDNVKFIGGVYNPVVLGKYLNESSIYVLAGMGGLSINEAMAFGKPVICSVCDGTEKKLVRENHNGKFFKEDNVEDLAEKIDLILSDDEMKKQMGEKSFSIIKNEINVETVINGYLKAFNFVLNKK